MKNLPLRKRILVVFSLVFLLLIALICALVSGYVRDNAIREQRAYLQSYAASVTQQTESLIREMNKISVLMYTSGDVDDIFSRALGFQGAGNYLPLQTAAHARVDDAVYSVVGPDIIDVIVNLYNARCFYSSKYFPVLWENVAESWEGGRLALIRDRLDRSSRPVVTRLESAYWTNAYNASHTYIALSRRLEKVTTHRDIGYIEVLVPIKRMARLFDTAASGQTVLLTDEQGGLLYHAGELPPELADFAAAPDPKAPQVIRSSQGDTYFYGVGALPRFGLTVFAFQKYDSTQHLRYTAVVLLAGLILYACMLALCAIISRRLSAPLGSIVTSLKGVSWDTLEMNLNLQDSAGEYAVLEDAFSAMTAKLRQSMDSIINARLNEQRAAFMALQSQISPHFIYNTIASISACAYENGVDKVVDICDRLSGLLRYASDYTSTLSDIEVEMEYTRNYLELMKARYENRFIYQLLCDPQCQGLQIPRLIIQSVLENCFKHAFKGVAPPWFISVQAGVRDGWWLVDIASGGKRIPPETLEGILRKSGEISRDICAGVGHLKPGGLGLVNAVTRLRLFTGEQFVFEVLDGENGVHVTRLGGRLS